MRGARLGRGGWIAVAVLGVVVVLLAASELFLPRYAAHRVASKLDGFTNVDIQLSSVSAAPIEVSAFSLTRRGNSSDYRLKMTGSTTASGLAGYVGGTLGALGASVLVPNASAPLPIRLDYGLRSDHGRAVVTGGAGQVAGVPLGPLGAAVTSAILDRISL